MQEGKVAMQIAVSSQARRRSSVLNVGLLQFFIWTTEESVKTIQLVRSWSKRCGGPANHHAIIAPWLNCCESRLHRSPLDSLSSIMNALAIAGQRQLGLACWTEAGWSRPTNLHGIWLNFPNTLLECGALNMQWETSSSDCEFKVD